MNVQAALSFAFSIYGLLALLAALLLFGVLWSDQLKSKWYDRVEKKKWNLHNRPKPVKTRPSVPTDRSPRP
jgi:hypothetical protein